MNNRQIALLAVLAGVGILAYRAVSAAGSRQEVVQTVPPPVAQGGSMQQWQLWIALALQVFGSVSALWQPGGPFYGKTPKQVYDSVPSSVHQQWNWNNPNEIPSGYA